MKGISFEDERYKLFGLSDKTKFTKEEYAVLRSTYQDFDTLWQLWKEYEKLMKINITAKNNQLTQMKTELNELPNKIQELKDKVQLYYEAWNEIKSDTAKHSEALKLLFTDKKNEFMEQRDSLINKKTNLPTQIENLETEIVNIKTKRANLLEQINNYLAKWNGILPEVK